MSATSKRDRALAAGIEPVTGKDLYKPAAVTEDTAPKVSKKRRKKKGA